jgi:hypothetical protein
MSGKAKRGDTPTAGPDWVDIGQTMREIEITHSATLELQIKTDGARFAGSVAVVVKATLPRLIGPALPFTLSLYSVWPSVKSKTLEGLVYQLLLQMDHRLGAEAYKQAAFEDFPLPRA